MKNNKENQSKAVIAPTIDEDEAATDILLEYAQFSCTAEVDNFDKLDSKSSTLAGFTAILIALSSNAIFVVFQQQPKVEFRLLSIFILTSARFCLVLLVIFLNISLVYFIKSLRLRKVKRVPSVSRVVNHYLGELFKENGKHRRLKKFIVNRIRHSEESFRESNRMKARALVIGTTYLLVSLICGTSGILLYMFYLINAK